MQIIPATSPQAPGTPDFLTLSAAVGVPRGNGKEGGGMYAGAMVVVHEGIYTNLR